MFTNNPACFEHPGFDPVITSQELMILEVRGFDPCSGDLHNQPCASLDEARALMKILLKTEDDIWVYDDKRKQIFAKSKKKLATDKLWIYGDVTMFCLGRASAR